jgi:DNA-binding NarL/FixJ family response regulator
LDSYSQPPRHSVFRPRTVLCERHELIRFGLKRVVSEVVEIVGEAADGMAAMDLIRRLRPDFVITDVDLDILNGVEICRRVHDEMPNANVLVLTDSYHATKYHNQLVRANARGFCLKSSGPRTLFEAIEQVTRGLPFTDPKITQLVKQSPATSMPNSNLTDREIEVLIRLDLRNKEISEELDMKLRTVEKHIECILAKLKVPTRTAAALKAVQLGYVLLPKMPGRDPVTGVTHEQTVAELQAELAIANEHLKALLKQNELLKEALNQKLQPSGQNLGGGSVNPNAPQTPPPQRPQPPPRRPEDDEQSPPRSLPPPDPFGPNN